jgi:phosphoglycolate phosphatase-like HAD superfamily hydrolase
MNFPAWLEVLNPNTKLGHVQYALFDFDGTISVIRHGWEQIMIAVMVESICEGGPIPSVIRAEVAQFVDQSTGILTIKQMKWLEEAVRRYGLAKTQRTAAEYKRIYNERLLKPVYERLAQLDNTQESHAAWTIQGVRGFLDQLAQRGVGLFLASGTDQEYVEKEAAALGVVEFFSGQIYGAKGTSEQDSKEMVIQRILDERGLSGEQLLVVGDGPVEIRYARQVGALALGVAANEAQRAGLDERKRQRLVNAGADLIITDFSHGAEFVELLCASNGLAPDHK